jgi:hypothetical protein
MVKGLKEKIGLLPGKAVDIGKETPDISSSF